MIDSYGIELCHPIRQVHQPNRQRIGKKGFASWRWIVGGKLCVLTNKFGLITDWDVKTANVSDTEFLPLVEAVGGKMIVPADKGFRRPPYRATGELEDILAWDVERPDAD